MFKRLFLAMLLASLSVIAQTTTTIPGDLRVRKHIRVDSLSGDSTMMVVSDTLGRLSVLPIPGGSSNVPANPTGTVGLTAVNGSASTYMRSDAAPALSQAIRPTWSDLHTFSDSIIFGSVITTPLTASRLLTVDASSQLAVNAALNANGFLYGSGSGGIASTAAAGNGQILIGSTGVAPVLGTLTGTTNQISVAQGAGTLGLSLPNTVVLPDSLNVTALQGAGTRMVVAGADGGLFTQEIPTGVSPANPTASLGLTAVNGVANTYMRSDAAPALSQSIAPTWTGLHDFTQGLAISGGSFAAGRLYRSASDGIVVAPVAGSVYDFSLVNTAGTNYLMRNPTGTNNLHFPSGSVDFSGAVAMASTLGVDDRVTLSENLAFDATGGSGSVDASLWRGPAIGLGIRGVTGSSYDLALFTPSATNAYLLRNPTGTQKLEFPGTDTNTFAGAIRASNLAGGGTRMVVADADGDLSTQSIPEAGSLADPTATIGLTAVNGVATSGMRSDGAPALSQAIRPSWSDLHTFSDSLLVTGAFSKTSSASNAPAKMLLRNTDASASNYLAGALLRMETGSSPGALSAPQVICMGSTTDAASGWCFGGKGDGTSLAFHDRNDDTTLTQPNAKFVLTSTGHTSYADFTITGNRNLSVDGTNSLALFNDSVHVVGRMKHGATVKTIATMSEGAASTTTLYLDTADLQKITLTKDQTFTVYSTGLDLTGRHFTIRVTQDGTGGHDITWGSEFTFPSSGAPTQVTSPSSRSYYSFMYNEVTSTWDYVGGALGFGGS